MYKVIKYFTDLQDNRHAYHAGDVFPREGLKVSKERLTELSGFNNKRGVPLIEKIKEEKPVEEPVKEQEEKPKRRTRKDKE